MGISVRFAFALIAAAAVVACNSPGTTNSVPGSAAVSRVSPDTANRPPEVFNQVLPYPCYSTTCPTDFEVVFKGDVTGDIPPNEPLSLHENAFCPPSTSTSCAPTATYNPTTNTTTLEYSGPTLYQNRTSGKPGVHFGIAAARNYSSIKSLETASYWTYPSSPAAQMPIVSINSKQPAKSKKWQYAVVYIAGTTVKGGGNEYETWNEIAYVPKGGNKAGAQPRFTFANYGSQTIYVTNAGVVLGLPVPKDKLCLKDPTCPEDMKMLANLQEDAFPPPGSSSSPFIKLQFPPASVLKPHK